MRLEETKYKLKVASMELSENSFKDAFPSSPFNLFEVMIAMEQRLNAGKQPIISLGYDDVAGYVKELDIKELKQVCPSMVVKRFRVQLDIHENTRSDKKFENKSFARKKLKQALDDIANI